MNAKASELGLGTTHYEDPSGLLAANVSSAYDMARLITIAASDERIGSIMRLPTYTVGSGKRTINVSSTNHLVREGEIDVRGGKTGFISRSGYCLATLLRLPQTGQQVAVVVLGAQSNAGPLLGDAPPVQLDGHPHTEAARHHRHRAGAATAALRVTSFKLQQFQVQKGSVYKRCPFCF